jgi:peroxiredoxin
MSRLSSSCRPRERASAVSLSLASGRAFTLREFAGEPFVLVLFAQPGAARVATLSPARLRADLGGLGMALVVISPDGVWRFRPDSGVELVAEGDALCPVELAGVFADYGLATGDEERYPDRAVYVIDHELRVVFERRYDANSEETDLALVLEASRRALVALPPAMTLSPELSAIARQGVTT